MRTILTNLFFLHVFFPWLQRCGELADSHSKKKKKIE